jgi:hypothetical protein
MPRMDGLEVARILRRELPESKVIIISQSDPALVRLQAEQVGAAAFVVKGDVSRDLLPAVSRISLLDPMKMHSMPLPARPRPLRVGWLAVENWGAGSRPMIGRRPRSVLSNNGRRA